MAASPRGSNGQARCLRLPCRPEQHPRPPSPALVEQVFWVEDGDAYVIVDYLEHAFPAEQVKQTRARWSKDKGSPPTARDRRPLAVRGPEVLPGEKGGAGRGFHARVPRVESTSGGSHLDQTRLDQTRPDRRSGSGSGMASRGRLRWSYAASAEGTEMPARCRQRHHPGPCPDEECLNDFEELKVCNGGGCAMQQDSNAWCENHGACAVVKFAEVTAVRERMTCQTLRQATSSRLSLCVQCSAERAEHQLVKGASRWAVMRGRLERPPSGRTRLADLPRSKPACEGERCERRGASVPQQGSGGGPFSAA